MINLFDFTYCGDYNRQIQNLARMVPEKWSFSDTDDNGILKGYLEHTFKRLYEEQKVWEKKNYAIFNTGLFNCYYQPIYAYFIPNLVPDRQRWFLDGFYTEYHLLKSGIVNLPKRAAYVTDPAELIFDTGLDIVPQYEHIFEEDFDLEIADSAGNNETAKNADIAEILSKTKEYLNEKNAVDEECDKKLSMPVKKTSALLDVRYTSLRQPYDSYTSLTERPGYLRLYGQESLNSCYNVSLVARRQQDRYVQVETCVEFAPTCREQMAGLAYMYDTGNFYLLVKTREEEFGSQTLDLKKPARLRLIKSDHFDVEDVIPAISIPEDGPVYLRVTTTQEGLYAKFFYSLDGKDYQELAEVPTNILTDEQSDGFTGAHFGMYCHDMTGVRRYADFDYFEIFKARKEQ